MTEKIFYEDSHRTSFTAKVLDCQKEAGHYAVVLDRTVFFPEGGGQYADTGYLQHAAEKDGKPEPVGEAVRITDVQESDGVIRHMADQELQVGQLVTGKIDWTERFMKMQQHTGEHIVSGIVHERFGYNNVGFHLGSEDCTMDFDGEITREELREIEWKANEAAARNLDVIVTYPSKEELAVLDYRSKIEIEGQVRIVTIPGYDVCACCAPHVEKTGEIGMIRLTNVQRYKGGARVTMLCGVRALADYDKKLDSVKAVSALLCAKEDEIASAVERLKEEYSALKLQLHEQEKQLLACKAAAVLEEEKTVCLIEEGLEGDAPRILMNLVLDAGHDICAVFCKNTKSSVKEKEPESGSEAQEYRYVIGSRRFNMRDLSKELNARFSGRGGGKPEMVQGSLTGSKEELRGWIQEKGKGLEDEQNS